LCFVASFCILGVCLCYPSLAQTLDSNSADTAESATVSVRQLKVSSKVRALLLRAEKDFSARKATEAIQTLNLALRDDPSCAEALTMRALIELATRDVQSAVADAAQAASLDPTNAKALLALATANNSNGNPDAATHSAEQALRLQPGLWQARLEIAKALYQKEQFPAAMHQLALVKVEFADVHLVRGDILMMLGRRQEGADEFRAFLLEAPRDSRAEPIRQILAQAAVSLDPMPAPQ
jgi:tetratricopeptide (TPR) repeat protein